MAEQDDLGKRLRATRGECPSDIELIQYADGTLEEIARARVESHLAFCGTCELLVSRMSDDAEEFLADSAAARVEGEARLARSFGAFLSRQRGKGTAVRSFPWRFLFHPAPGYVLALLLAVPAVLYLRQLRTETPAPPVTVSLKPVDGAQRIELERKRTEGGPVRVATSGQHFILSFVIAIRPDARYVAQIERADGLKVGDRVNLVPNEDGYFYLVCDRSVFMPGEYRLRVWEESESDVREVFSFLVP